MRRRPGAASVAELLLVLWLFGLVLAATGGFASALGRLAAAQRDRSRAQELVRTARVVLQAELRHGLGAQVPAHGDGWVRLRAVRGSGVTCRADGDELVVRYDGVRWPDPDKDSVLVVTRGGVAVAGAVLAVSGTGECGAGDGPGDGPGDGGARVRLRVERPPPGGDGLLLVYEAGTYQVAAGALRYQRGAAGRQPLTEAILSAAATMALQPGALDLRLDFRRDSLRVPGIPAAMAVARLNGMEEP